MTEFLLDAIDSQSPILDIICEALPAGVMVYDRNDHMVFASKQILNFFSLPTDVLMPGTRLRDFLAAVYDSRPRSAKVEGSKSLIGREEWVAERLATHWRERADGVETYGYGRYMRFVKRRFPNGIGICLMTDVSENHKREEQWKADLARVQLTEEILDNLPFPVFVKDANLTYVAVNRAFARLRGTTPEDILGHTVHDFAPPEVARVFDQTDRQVMESGEMASVPERLLSPEGAEISVITRKLRIGRPGRYMLLTTMEDVSELTEGHDGPGWMDSQFHPPRFPNIEQGEIPDMPFGERAAAAPMETILPDRFNGRRVLLVSNDVTIEAQAGRVCYRLGMDWACVHSALEQEAFLRAATEAGVDIDVMVIDSQMERRAIELAESHGINVLVMDGWEMAGELTYQLVRHFNNPHARPGDRNPMDDWEIETIIAEPSATFSMVDVLVVEDNPVNQIVFSQILEGLGHSHRIAATGAEGLAIAQELGPRVILLDQTLPDMLPKAFLAGIRNGPPVLAETPVIAVIVAGQQPDEGQCRAAGMDGVLAKPVSPETVESLLRQILGAELRPVAAA